FFVKKRGKKLLCLGRAQASGEGAARPGPLEDVAAAVAVDVQHLAAGEEMRDYAALERFRAKLRGAHAAGRHLGGGETLRAAYGQAEALAGAGRRAQLALRQLRERLARVQ